MLNLHDPEVRRFYRAAVAHRDAARLLLDHCPERTASTRGHQVVYFSGYVVECSLKALFLSASPAKKHVEIVQWFKAEVKHNLERLRVELSKCGVVFPRIQLEHLRRVRTSWYSEMRYQTLAWGRSEAEKVYVAAEAVFAWSTRS